MSTKICVCVCVCVCVCMCVCVCGEEGTAFKCVCVCGGGGGLIGGGSSWSEGLTHPPTQRLKTSGESEEKALERMAFKMHAAD